MMNNSSKFMFIIIIMIGTMISISANSWLTAWMGLEINLLAFIPLMSENELMSTEASLKYFLTQALASIVFLFSIILLMINHNFIFQLYMNMFISMMTVSSLFLKSGAAPFHFWFPTVMEGLNWTNSLIMMTWQKIAPLMLISYLIIKPLMIFVIICSAIIGAIGGMNQTSLRKLMAFSSINHLSWMMAAMMFSENLWMIYFLFYSLMNIIMIFMFNNFKLFHINQLLTNYFNSKMMKFLLFLNLLSLSGLPPFMGFFPKWLIIQNLIMNNQLIMLLIMIMMTLITLFFYLRLCYSTFLLNYFENNWTNLMQINNFDNKIILFMSMISIFSLPLLISFLYFML